MNIDELINLYVGSVCKSTGSIDILICDDKMVICICDASLCIIDIGMNTNIYTAFQYGNDWHESDKNIRSKVFAYWNTYDNICRYSPVIAEMDDLRSVEEYNSLLGRRANEGLGVYRMPSDILYQSVWIPVFTGFPVLVKQDKIGVQIRRIDDTSLLLQYNIYKHKLKKSITQWCRILDMNRPTKPSKAIHNK